MCNLKSVRTNKKTLSYKPGKKKDLTIYIYFSHNTELSPFLLSLSFSLHFFAVWEFMFSGWASYSVSPLLQIISLSWWSWCSCSPCCNQGWSLCVWGWFFMFGSPNNWSWKLPCPKFHSGNSYRKWSTGSSSSEVFSCCRHKL